MRMMEITIALHNNTAKVNKLTIEHITDVLSSVGTRPFISIRQTTSLGARLSAVGISSS